MNRDLIGDEKDREIARLKFIIEKFKKYDEERKEYYSKKLERLGVLESYVEELEDTSEIGKLKSIIVRQKDELRKLNAVIIAKKIDTTKTEEEWNNVDISMKISRLKEENKKLREEIKNLRETIGKLIYECNKDKI